MDWDTFQLETPRLDLRPVTLTDASEIFAAFTPDIARYLYPKAPDRLEETQHFIRQAVQGRHQGYDLTLVIRQKSDQSFLGMTGIHDIHTSHPELGIWLKRSAQGLGVGRETIHALKDWIAENLDAEYIVYSVDRRNLPSRKIAESLGGEIYRESQVMNLSGQILDSLEYHIHL
ncbi:GNAT family N-acetyltransferase [Geitlerinema sp. PCC 7407]|uniref:GNAT family N-acetyltransferase n=1 Tax=Geitlerinema sp. PCC 7407 TaxID=1173025 RepID=UPI00029F93A3|nr:GNAT family N-acetyltransferase [Geitlerinema sp. PCC 7407]AFY65001.1 GCN5-related N-acetyltransferase [Geitlerinema sp. PCC 7407]